MITNKSLLLILLLLLISKKTYSQEFKQHIGINFNAVSQTLTFSPIGLKFFGDLIFNDKLNLRTNLSANYHSVSTKEYNSLSSCFFTQLEETVIYSSNRYLTDFFIGCGVGYYAIVNNGEVSHLYHPDPTNYNLFVGNDNYDSNIGFHFLIGKDGGSIIIELKYLFTIFQHNQYQQESIDFTSIERIVSKNETYHIISFSINI